MRVMLGVRVELSVAVPIGPNALFCMSRVMHGGLWGGFLTGLRTALANAPSQHPRGWRVHGDNYAAPGPLKPKAL